MKQQAKPKNHGFTLIELMVAMVISIIVMGAIYAVYISQTRVQVTQEVHLELQENLRAALTIMTQEIRTAGADPTYRAGAEIIKAVDDELHFTRDITGGNIDGRPSYDGTTNNPSENIRYKVCPNNNHLGRDISGEEDDDKLQPLLDNVDALNFVYLDINGTRLGTPVSDGELDDIREILVTIVYRSGQSDRGLLGFGQHTDNMTYRNSHEDEDIIFDANDNARRISLNTSITLRNMPK